MGVIDELIANNAAFASSLPARHLDVQPTRRLAIVTCMDSRLDVFAALHLRDGEAHVLRNAGGVITDDVIRSLAISQRRLTRKVGTRQQVIFDQVEGASGRGRTKGDAPEIDGTVHVTGHRPLRVGEIATVKIDRADAYDLHGTVVGF